MISGAFSFYPRSNSGSRLLKSGFDGGLGKATFLLIGYKASVELANWFHNTSVEECLQSGDNVPLSPDGWSCHGGVFRAVGGGHVDLTNGGSGLAMEQRQGSHLTKAKN